MWLLFHSFLWYQRTLSIKKFDFRNALCDFIVVTKALPFYDSYYDTSTQLYYIRSLKPESSIESARRANRLVCSGQMRSHGGVVKSPGSKKIPISEGVSPPPPWGGVRFCLFELFCYFLFALLIFEGIFESVWRWRRVFWSLGRRKKRVVEWSGKGSEVEVDVDLATAKRRDGIFVFIIVLDENVPLVRYLQGVYFAMKASCFMVFCFFFLVAIPKPQVRCRLIIHIFGVFLFIPWNLRRFIRQFNLQT